MSVELTHMVGFVNQVVVGSLDLQNRTHEMVILTPLSSDVKIY